MVFYQLCTVVALVVVCLAQEECEQDGCTSSDVALLPATNNRATDHYYIGASFSIHEQGTDAYSCGKTWLRGLINAEAFFWAIKKYSEKAGLNNAVDPVSVGGFVMDSCLRTEKAIEDVYSFETCRTQFTNVSPRNTLALVGPSTSSQAVATASLLNDLKVTQVSSSATSPELSDSDKYKYFLRTVPSDALQTQVIAKMLNLNAVKYIQVLYHESAFGMGLFEALKDDVAPEDIDVCITDHMSFGSSDIAIQNFLKANKKTKYVVVLGTHTEARFVLEAAQGDSETRDNFVFVGTLSWGTDPTVISGLSSAANAITLTFDMTSSPYNSDVDDFYDELFLMDPDTGSNFNDPNVNMYNPWFTKYWEEAFSCNFAVGTCDLPNQRLEDKVDRSDPYVPFTLMAVDAIIKGVKNAAMKECSGIHVCSSLLNPGNIRETDLFNLIKNSTNDLNQRYFDAKGDAAASGVNYKIYRVMNGEYKNVLNYDPSRQANMGFDTVPGVSWNPISSSCPESPCLRCGELPDTTVAPPKTTTTAEPDTTREPLQISDVLELMYFRYFNRDQEFTGVWRDMLRLDADSKTRFENGYDWIIALGVCAGLGIVCVLVFEIYILYKLMGTKIGKQWRTMWLGQLLLFGLFCSYLVLFAFLFTPTKATCGITRFGVGVSYAMCFAILLVKLMVLLTSKTSADTLLPGDVDSPNYLRGIYQFLMFIFVVGVQIVIAIQWLIQVPPEAVQVYSNNGELVWICNHYTWALSEGWSNMTTFVRTDFENHLISLSYIMFLILLTTIIAMKAHGIITNHRESVFIGIAAGFTIPVWVAWGLVGGLNKDHQYAQEFGDAAIAFGLFITATIVLFAMFLPKVRQLVNMGVEGIYLEDDRDTYYAGSVVMAPPSYKSRPSSVVYVNSNGYNDPVIIGDQNAVHLRHPGSNYSAPVYVKKPESAYGGTGKVLRVTGDLTGKHPRESKKSMSEAGYAYAGSGYGTYRKARSESGGTLRRAHSTQDLGAL